MSSIWHSLISLILYGVSRVVDNEWVKLGFNIGTRRAVRSWQAVGICIDGTCPHPGVAPWWGGPWFTGHVHETPADLAALQDLLDRSYATAGRGPMDPERAKKLLTDQLAELDERERWARRRDDAQLPDHGALSQHPADYGSDLTDEIERELMVKTIS